MKQQLDVPAFSELPQAIEKVRSAADIEQRLLPMLARGGAGFSGHSDGHLQQIQFALQRQVLLCEDGDQREGLCKLRLGECEAFLVSLRALPGCLQLFRQPRLLPLIHHRRRRFAGGGLRTPQVFLQLFHAPLQDDIVLSSRLQARLLPGDLVVPRLDIQLQSAQTREIEPAGAADEMRQHVHFAENIVHQRTIAGRMAHDGPIGARYIAVIDGLVPLDLDLGRRRKL